MVFKKFAEKELKTKFYRYGGPEGIVQTTRGTGILFFYHNDKAVRINLIKGEVVSLTLWDSYKLGHAGDYTVDLDGLNLFQAKTKIIQLIKKPKVGTIEIYPEILDEAYLEEAKRISPVEFASLIQKHAPTAHLNSVPWDVITDIALKNDVLIPSFVHNTRIDGTKGKNAKYDLTKFTKSIEIF